METQTVSLSLEEIGSDGQKNLRNLSTSFTLSLTERLKLLLQNPPLQAQLKFADHMDEQNKPSRGSFYGHMRQKLRCLATVARGMFDDMQLSSMVHQTTSEFFS